MICIQGFVCAVPTDNRQTYIDHALIATEVFREHGCLSAVECWGDDVPDGKLTSFPMAVQAKASETVIFAWYIWPSKAAHNAGLQAAMSDPRLSAENNPMPFDGQRVIFGTFEPLLEIGAPQPGGYVDGFVTAVPRDKRDAFRDFAAYCDPIFTEFGANWIVEAWEDEIPNGKITDFRRAVQATPDEAVLYSWVQWPDKATRDAGNSRMVDDPRFANLAMPFDGKRMIYGGFVPVVEG